jgi:hypothetical protein
MTKKDYLALAQSLRHVAEIIQLEHHEPLENYVAQRIWDKCLRAVIEACRLNERFDEPKFRKAITSQED